jgi:hypothetical protein
MVVTRLKQMVPKPIKRLFRKRELLHMGYVVRRFVHGLRYGSGARVLVQQVPSFDSGVAFASSEEIAATLARAGIAYAEGHHTVYVHREEDVRRIHPSLAERYPQPFGLKIIKSREMAPDGTPYYTSHRIGPSSTPMTMRGVGSAREKMVISNLLSLRGVAPRTFDLIRLQSGAASAFALVVRHVGGEIVRGPEAEAFVERFMRVLDEEGISILGLEKNRPHADFTPPDFRNNVLADASGTYYVDIQNFAIFGNGTRNEELLETIGEKTHFGSGRAFRSSRYAYQSVPGLSRSGKRDMQYRIAQIRGFLGEHGFSVRDRTVLDVGCNLGVLLMNALDQGARWGVGLDTPQVAPVTRRFLFQQGFSRFDVFGCDLRDLATLELLPLRAFDLVLFMSIENHIGFPGWLDALELGHFLYEGHQRESIDDIVNKFRAWRPKAEILGHRVSADGDSEPRPMLLARLR